MGTSNRNETNLFLGGILPGILIALRLCGYAVYSMPADYQNLVINILDEIAADNMARYDEINDSDLNTLISQNGCEVCELSGDVLKAMREIGEPIWKSMQEELGEEISSAFNDTMQTIQ